MAEHELDVLVIGGGITGAGAALDAATRGLRVGLIEARDYASGTSSKSSKLIHGGLRYLEMLDFGLVREALRERELLLTRLAPHLVKPVPFLWPLTHRGWERVYLGAGLALYDRLGGRAQRAGDAASLARRRAEDRAGAAARTPSWAACSSTTRRRTMRGSSPTLRARPQQHGASLATPGQRHGLPARRRARRRGDGA